MNSNLLNREDYVLKILPISREDDKNACFRLLTLTNKHLLLCHNQYDEKYINSVIEAGNFILYYHTKHNLDEIVSFAVVKINRKVCDILLLYAIPNTKSYGRMIAYSVYGFAIIKKCDKIYVVPRTELLRDTFIKYGFEHLRGVKNYDEVLVKYIHLNTYTKTQFTKRKRRTTNKQNNRILQYVNTNSNTIQNYNTLAF